MLANQLTKGDGIIPRFFRQKHCWLFEGHEWKRCSPEYQDMHVTNAQHVENISILII